MILFMPSKEKINFLVREIEEEDLQNGLFQTLSNLTEIGKIYNDVIKAKKILQEIKTCPFYKIFVAVKDDGVIIGTTTILIEQKFIHDGGRIGHIEDVATRNDYEGLGVGSALIRACLDFAKKKNCYKVILDCSEKNIPFYKKIGFKEHDTSMRYDIT
jgi:glucosamine-phosphate N-acetyltransferase